MTFINFAKLHDNLLLKYVKNGQVCKMHDVVTY